MGKPAATVEPAWEPIVATIEGTRLEVIEDGGARLDAILRLIGEARSSVRLLFYIFNSDRVGRLVRDALVDAAGRGVKVHVLLDGYGCSGAEPDFFAPLSSAGGKLCLFHPRYGRRYLLRNHQKLVVADGCRALIGGANIHDAYLTEEGDRRWRDLWLLIDGPVVADAGQYFDALYRWTRKKGAKLRSLRRLVVRHTQSRGRLQWKFAGPLSRRNPWPRLLAREIGSASRLDVIAAYFAPPRSFLRRIAGVARRGGRARIITAAMSDNNATIAAARHTYSRLLRRGIEMYEYRPARLHTKLIIVDDAVHIGSANLDFRSIYLNLEIMLRIEDAAFADRMRAYFERELAQSELITAELHRSRANPWRRFKWMVSHWLVTTMDYTVTRRLNFRAEA